MHMCVLLFHSVKFGSRMIDRGYDCAALNSEFSILRSGKCRNGQEMLCNTWKIINSTKTMSKVYGIVANLDAFDYSTKFMCSSSAVYDLLQ